MRLNLGCGKDIRKGFVNIDLRKLPGVDVVADVSDQYEMLKFNKKVDFILARDILEHFPRQKSRSVLKLWVEILRPGGRIRIQCPEIRHACSLNQPDEWLERLLYGGQDYEENYHKTGFTTKMLAKALELSGCRVLKTELTPSGNLVMEAEKIST